MSTPENYETWLRRARLGDERAWSLIVSEFQRLVYSIPKRSGFSDADCDDVFQATFVALYKNLDRIEDARTMPKWLAVTASREVYRISRLNASTSTSENLDEVLAVEDAQAEQLAFESIQSESLYAALAKLGGRCERLLKMLYFDERAYQEITEALNIAIGAIGPTRARCLDKLRRIFAG